MRHYLALMMPAGLAYRLIPALALVLVLAALVAIFIQAPTEATLGDVQRIFYFHVASAWTAFLAFFVVFGAGIAYLRTRALKWDALASSSAEIGVIFTGRSQVLRGVDQGPFDTFHSGVGIVLAAERDESGNKRSRHRRTAHQFVATRF